MNEGRGFSIRDVLLQGLFIIVFVFILMWLFPMKGDVKKALDPLYQRIFNDNVTTMQDAAKSYYSTARLPKNVGDKVSMTLGDMLDKKLVLPFVDSKNNQCDQNNSYVEITKMDDEYNLKVNLQCDDKNDYVIAHMGCYSYCATAICEKEVPTEKPIVNKPANNVPTNNNNYSNDNGTVYYEYYTQTIEKEPYNTIVKVPYSVPYNANMCIYKQVSRNTKNFYSVSYVGATTTHYTDNQGHHYGFILNSNASNVILKDVDEGKNYFNLSTYLNQKSDGTVYDYSNTSYSYNAYVPSSTTTFNKSAFSSSEITSVYVNGTTNYNNVYVARDWNVYNGYKFDYSYYLSDSRINSEIDSGNIVRNYDYNQGYIFFVPLRFTVQYDIVYDNILTAECSNLNSAEDDYIINNYVATQYRTEYADQTKVEYNDIVKNSGTKWTTQTGVAGYIYTGAQKIVR